MHKSHHLQKRNETVDIQQEAYQRYQQVQNVNAPYDTTYDTLLRDQKEGAPPKGTPRRNRAPYTANRVRPVTARILPQPGAAPVPLQRKSTLYAGLGRMRNPRHHRTPVPHRAV